MSEAPCQKEIGINANIRRIPGTVHLHANILSRQEETRSHSFQIPLKMLYNLKKGEFICLKQKLKII